MGRTKSNTMAENSSRCATPSIVSTLSLVVQRCRFCKNGELLTTGEVDGDDDEKTSTICSVTVACCIGDGCVAIAN